MSNLDALSSVQMITIVALVLFSVLMIGIGIASARKAKDIEGFLLGGRNIGPWISAFAYGTTYFSAVIFVGYAGTHGWNVGFPSMWIGIGNAVLGCWLAWVLLAERTRAMTHRLGAKTMPEFFGERYDSVAMKVFAAAIIFLFLVPYSAAVYKGLGSLFVTIFPGANIVICMLIVAVLTAIYLVFGGYVATAYTDFVQGIIMIAGVVIMVFAVVYNNQAGGFMSAVQKVRELGVADGNPDLVSWFGGRNWSFLTINIILTSFGTWGLPQMVTKYYAVKDKKSIRTATVVSTFFALIIGGGAYFVGSLGRIFLNNQLPAQGYDFIVPQTLMNSLGMDGNIFTTIILAVVLLLLLSASMSTLSSIVLSSSSAISVDFIPVVYPNFKKNHQMLLTRVLCLVFVGMSLLFAVANISFIVNLMSFSWGVVAGCFMGPFLFGLYSKKITKTGAWCGLLSGVVVVGALTLFYSLRLGSFKAAMMLAPQFGVVAFVISLLSTWCVSKFTKNVPEEAAERAFGTV